MTSLEDSACCGDDISFLNDDDWVNRNLYKY